MKVTYNKKKGYLHIQNSEAENTISNEVTVLNTHFITGMSVTRFKSGKLKHLAVSCGWAFEWKFSEDNNEPDAEYLIKIIENVLGA